MIGSNLTRRLVDLGHRVTVVDNLWRGKRENLLDASGKPVIDFANDFHELDLSKPGQIDRLLSGVDYVYHLADVVAGIGYVFSNQRQIFRQNLLINSNVLESVGGSNVCGLIYVGTACSFPAFKQSGVHAPPLREEDQYPAAPESAYGWSKLMGEYEALLMEKEAGKSVSVLILHNVYGSPCDLDPKRSQVIPALVRKAILYPSEPFKVWGNGEQGRAFVHVDDVVDALVLAKDRGLGAGPIQIGPSVCTTIRELADTIIAISGKEITAEYDTSKPSGDAGRCADHSKATQILGWSPKIDLTDGLRTLYRWAEAQMDARQAVSAK